MAQLTEEVGSTQLPRRYGEQSEKAKILGELADVVLWFYVSQIKLELIYKLLSIRKWNLNEISRSKKNG
jgi:hypothetical protein